MVGEQIKTEEQFVDFVKRETKSPRAPFGIGDDAALIRSAKNQVITTDFLVEGVDFEKGESLRRVARKALAVNLSDVAAMGAQPKQALLYVAFPKKNRKPTSAKWKDFFKGWNSLAAPYKISLIGGDVSAGPAWMVGVVLVGEVCDGKVLERSKARAGDLLWVTGSLGGSILGRQFSFKPRIEEALFLKRFPVSSCIDLSDGIAKDLPRLLKASRKGVRFEIDQIPISQDAVKLSKKTKRNVLEHALNDGEDFELLFTLSSRYEKRLKTAWKKKFENVPLTVIGKVNAGSKIEFFSGKEKVVLRSSYRKGFDHLK